MQVIKLANDQWSFDPESMLGRAGGFGAVFRGQGADGEAVAIKRLHLRVGQAANREMKLAAALTRRDLKRVVPVLDYGRDEQSKSYYLVMPLCAESLQDRLDREGRLDEAQARAIVLDIAHGLREVNDIVHRDLKPANVLHQGGGWALADFGIAKFVEDSTSLETMRDFLTASYAAPEQWRGEAPTHATDVYALGCIFYRLLSGRTPFEGIEALREAHLEQRPVPIADINEGLSSLISRMMRKSPQARPTIPRIIQTLENSAVGPRNDAVVRAMRRIADEQVEREVSHAGERSYLAVRQALVDEALVELELIRANLKNELERTTEANCAGEHRILLGNGVLILGPSERLSLRDDRGASYGIEPQLRAGGKRSGWDVLAFARLEIQQKNYDRRGPRGVFYSWKSTLFFGRVGADAEWRWWEVAFYSLDSFAETRNTIEFLPTNEDKFDMALSGEPYVTQIAFGPKPCDGEDEPTARSVWIALLARAAVSELRHSPPPIPVTEDYLSALLA